MRTIVLVAIACVGFAACTVGSVPPPADLQVSKAQEPVSPVDIQDDPACRLFRWPLSPSVAAEILRQTQIFADTGIYFAGEPPPQIAAFNVLLDQDDAVRWFDDIARTSGQVGRLYALSAFELLDLRRARALAAE